MSESIIFPFLRTLLFLVILYLKWPSFKRFILSGKVYSTRAVEVSVKNTLTLRPLFIGNPYRQRDSFVEWGKSQVTISPKLHIRFSIKIVNLNHNRRTYTTEKVHILTRKSFFIWSCETVVGSLLSVRKWFSLRFVNFTFSLCNWFTFLV